MAASIGAPADEWEYFSGGGAKAREWSLVLVLHALVSSPASGLARASALTYNAGVCMLKANLVAQVTHPRIADSRSTDASGLRHIAPT